MNRIRKYNDKYQVLVTPHQKYNTSFEFMLGSWTDPALRNFKVLTFDTLYEAEVHALEYPDINWQQLIEYNKDNYAFFYKEIKEVLENSNITSEFKCNLMNHKDIKNVMFNRVLSYGDDFRLVYHMNDIFSFDIINPWSRNLAELEQHLIRHSRLKIFDKFNKNGVVHLIGRTDIGTTYEIVLWPNMIYHWNQWKEKNFTSPMSKRDVYRIKKSFANTLKIQKDIDKSFIIR